MVEMASEETKCYSICNPKSIANLQCCYYNLWNDRQNSREL